MKHLIFMAVTLLIPIGVTASPLMYVPTGNANDVVIINLKTNKIIGRIDELENAHGLAANPNSEYLVAGSMQPIDTEEGRGLAKPGTVSEAEHAAHHSGEADNGSVKNPSYLSIIHPKHGHVMRRVAVRALTHHTAVSPDGRFAIAVHSGAGGISVVDLEKMAVIKTIQTGNLPNYAVFNRKGDRLYVSNAQPGTVSDIDTSDWTIKREISVGKKPEHMALSVDGSTLFVVNVEEGTAAVVDLKKGTVAARFDVGVKPHGIDVSGDGRWLFVSSKGGDRLSRIDLANNDVLSINLEPAPYHLDFVTEVNKLYVSSRKLPKIWVIDPVNMKVSHEIDIGKGVAHQMVILNR
jgi:DNA-binding beta-propeller fold protein YncE